MHEEMSRSEKWGWGFTLTGVALAEWGFYELGDWAVDKVACGVENVKNGIAAFRYSLNEALEPQYFEQMAHSEPAAAWGVAGGVLTAAAGLYALYKATPYWLEAPFRLADTLFKQKPAPNTPL